MISWITNYTVVTFLHYTSQSGKKSEENYSTLQNYVGCQESTIDIQQLDLMTLAFKKERKNCIYIFQR